ncbi:MAG: PilZ domain-containing protein [Candidatus Omnitrophota bacterium]
MWRGINKRQFPRVDYPCKVAILKDKPFSAHTENIGTGGICVVMKEELAKFSSVGLVLDLNDKRDALECNGSVVWAVPRDKAFDIGIEFSDIKEADRLRIENILKGV